MVILLGDKERKKERKDKFVTLRQTFLYFAINLCAIIWDDRSKSIIIIDNNSNNNNNNYTLFLISTRFGQFGVESRHVVIVNRCFIYP